MSWQQDPPVVQRLLTTARRKALKLFPISRLEVGIFPPNYLAHSSSVPDGFGDLAFQVKFRAFSATEGHGDYFVGFFLVARSPTGTPPNGLGHTILSPTLAAAKGIGRWDVQTTLGANLPVSGSSILGRAIVFNTAVDYKIRGRIWPMLEQNSVFLVGRDTGWKKTSFLDARTRLGLFSSRGKTSFRHRRRCADRSDAVPSV